MNNPIAYFQDFILKCELVGRFGKSIGGIT